MKLAVAKERILPGLRVCELNSRVGWAATPDESRILREGVIAQLHDTYLTILWDGAAAAAMHDWNDLIKHDSRIGAIRRGSLGITVSRLKH